MSAAKNTTESAEGRAPAPAAAPSSSWLGPMHRWFSMVDVTVIIFVICGLYAAGSIWYEQWQHHCSFLHDANCYCEIHQDSTDHGAETAENSPQGETNYGESSKVADKVADDSKTAVAVNPLRRPVGAPYVSRIRLAPGSVLICDDENLPSGLTAVISEPTITAPTITPPSAPVPSAPSIGGIAQTKPPGASFEPSGGSAPPKPRARKKKSAASMLLARSASLVPATTAPPRATAPAPTSPAMEESAPSTGAASSPALAKTAQTTIAYGVVQSPEISAGTKQPLPPPPPPAIASDDHTRYVDKQDNTLVKVFYGTDRFSVVYTPDRIVDRLVRFLPATIVCMVAFVMAWIATEYRRRWAMVVMSFSLLLGVGMIYYATQSTLTIAADARAKRTVYTSRRNPGGEINLGVCEVSIPKFHKPWTVDAPSITRLEVCENEDRHIVLKQTKVLQQDAFYTQLNETVGNANSKELFVFVHGFNVSFDDAAKRTAQMAHDMQFEGAPVFFSWPANQSSLLTYTVDETNVAWAMPHLKKFLLELVEKSGAKSINLIAHSMGNRALTSALKEIHLEQRGEHFPPFNQCVLAAPDVDAEDFAENLIPLLAKTAQRTTLYASKHDDALKASQYVHRYARAGDSSSGLVIVPGLDTIDVSTVDSSPWGHSYYGSSDVVLADIRSLFYENLPPHRRVGLAAQKFREKDYWAFDRDLIARGLSTEKITR